MERAGGSNRHEAVPGARWALRLGAFAMLLAGEGLIARRLEAIGAAALFAVLALAALAAFGALVATALAMGRVWVEGGRGSARAILGTCLALIGLAPGAYAAVETARLPRLTDVTTDAFDPPQFLFLSDTVPVDAGLAGRSVATPPPAAFTIALDALDALGWRILLEAVPILGGGGRLEAALHAGPLGITVELAIRLRPEGRGTRIEVRARTDSPHDLGALTPAIDAFLDAFDVEIRSAQAGA